MSCVAGRGIPLSDHVCEVTELFQGGTSHGFGRMALAPGEEATSSRILCT